MFPKKSAYRSKRKQAFLRESCVIISEISTGLDLLTFRNSVIRLVEYIGLNLITAIKFFFFFGFVFKQVKLAMQLKNGCPSLV